MLFIVVMWIIEILSAVALVAFAIGVLSGPKKVTAAVHRAPIIHHKKEPVPVKEEEPHHLPEIVDHIDAQEADEMLSDELAMEFVIVEHEGHKTIGLKGHVNLGDVDKAFKAGQVVTLDKLKAKGLVNKKIKRIKVLADGVLNKPLMVKAHGFSIQAIKMIELTGGTVVKLK